MLELQHIHKVYNPGTVTEMCLFDDFNLSVKQGEFVSIVGSNGSGKTSMLNIICGSIPIEGGKVLIGGKDISFNLSVKQGEFVSIVGSNGSGKTSMLNIICGSIPIEGGKVLIGGKDISKMKEFQRYRTIGRVYQNPSTGTCPNLTMLENMSLADQKGKLFGLGRGYLVWVEVSTKQEKIITKNSFLYWGWGWKIKCMSNWERCQADNDKLLHW